MKELPGNLPIDLRERVRWHPASAQCQPLPEGRLVLYWMQTAMRLEENPALEVAGQLAIALGLPLLIYQGVSSRHQYASDRHHRFILEGCADLQLAAQQRGFSYALYIERQSRQSPLAELLEQAALLIVEDMPTDPHRRFVQAALRGRQCAALAVDTACTAPMQLVGRSYDRAFEYRDKTRGLYQVRLKRPWLAGPAAPEPYRVDELSWRTVLEADHDGQIDELIAQCDIDHTVPPVVGTRGGSAAGMARWREFKSTKLRRYADDRNDPLKLGNSRLSAYLHYGMISPLAIAREAAEIGGAGAEKFLDELLIWRELAYAFCHFRPDHDRWSAIPDWAQNTLAQHLKDARSHVYSWETLARAATSDRFWNVAQRWLLRCGELHNNVRMTWGKALLQWCAQPREALRQMIDLNHRYALDGRDPASYGGLLWCFGQFDRPFYPAGPVCGTVRPRPTQEHARRLDAAAYEQQLLNMSPGYNRSHRVAIVGAGLAGLWAARTLHDQGIEATVYEKSLGPSGRMSTRHSTQADFDHGAQYFTCRDRRFRRYVTSWLQRGLVQPWEAPVAVYENGAPIGLSRTQRFVAVPGMNELGKYLASDLNIQYGVRIAALEKSPEGWQLRDDREGLRGHYDQVVIALPAPPAAELAAAASSELSHALRQFAYDPCWAVLLNLAQPLSVSWGAAFLNGGPVRWLARNQTKPGRRTDQESLVVHAAGLWSREHLEFAPERVVELLACAVSEQLGFPLPSITFSAAHRWRYAIPTSGTGLSQRVLVNQDRTLIACGDWASGSRVEGAFLSGAAASGMVMRQCARLMAS